MSTSGSLVQLTDSVEYGLTDIQAQMKQPFDRFNRASHSSAKRRRRARAVRRLLRIEEYYANSGAMDLKILRQTYVAHKDPRKVKDEDLDDGEA
ncbi:unnamed protein product [Durusdinium trenchii]|uniref:Uncharacterized protein n=1 Tax=Durusdinium trenchii TaxID=1381693 RepID=A0ABP0JJP3_9DINO